MTLQDHATDTVVDTWHAHATATLHDLAVATVDAVLDLAVRHLADLGHHDAARALDPTWVPPLRVVDARTHDQLLALERERVRWVPVRGHAR